MGKLQKYEDFLVTFPLEKLLRLGNEKKLMVLLALSVTQLQAQDLAHYKRVIKEISSAKYQGRGYAKGGANSRLLCQAQASV